MKDKPGHIHACRSKRSREVISCPLARSRATGGSRGISGPGPPRGAPRRPATAGPDLLFQPPPQNPVAALRQLPELMYPETAAGQPEEEGDAAARQRPTVPHAGRSAQAAGQGEGRLRTSTPCGKLLCDAEEISLASSVGLRARGEGLIFPRNHELSKLVTFAPPTSCQRVYTPVFPIRARFAK